MDLTGPFAATAIALYAAHHVGDYWVQTDAQARLKAGCRLHCLLHVFSYLMTQLVALWIMSAVTGWWPNPFAVMAALAVSGVTHYIADRRAPLVRIAGWIPGKANFLRLGVPRAHTVWAGVDLHNAPDMAPHRLDNPCLGTGPWALDQSWHIFWGVFVAALVVVGLS